MVQLIDRADADDPIARQFVPDARELQQLPQERADPLGEERLSPVPGIVHRYPDRVLLKLTHVCPVYCRFCFRREVVGPGGPQALSRQGARRGARPTSPARPSIWEVILTGGDPFMLSPRRIAEVTRRLGAIAHVKVLRWHTRVPVVDPGRVSRRAGRGAASRRPRRSTWRCTPTMPRELTGGGAGRVRAPCRCRHPHAEPDRAAQGRQRRCGDAGRAHARLRRGARETLLPAPPRSRRPAPATSAPRSPRARR